MRIAQPQTETEWSLYYDLRWRILRAPWDQPRGSERDDLEEESLHLLASDPCGKPIGVGRIHFNSLTEAQIRFMAVEETHRGRGIGARILAELERLARERGATSVVLEAREVAEAFYARHGYQVIGAGKCLFGSVKHQRMQKSMPAQ